MQKLLFIPAFDLVAYGICNAYDFNYTFTTNPESWREVNAQTIDKSNSGIEGNPFKVQTKIYSAFPDFCDYIPVSKNPGVLLTDSAHAKDYRYTFTIELIKS